MGRSFELAFLRGLRGCCCFVVVINTAVWHSWTVDTAAMSSPQIKHSEEEEIFVSANAQFSLFGLLIMVEGSLGYILTAFSDLEHPERGVLLDDFCLP